MVGMTEHRQPTRIDAIAEGWVDTVARLDPVLAVYIGRESAGLPDLSPDGHAELVREAAAVRAALAAADPIDQVDRVTAADLGGELDLIAESDAAGLHLRDLNVIASPAQDVRQIIDLMPQETPDDWAAVADRLRAMPVALGGYTETLRQGMREGVVPARRQVEAVAELVDGYAAKFFAELPGGAPEAVRGDVERAASGSADAYRALASFLRTELLPTATETDAVGRDAYALHSRRFLGADIDLDEAYEWGAEELARMVEEQERTAREIVPGGSVADAIAALDADPSRTLDGVDALRRWMQETSDRAVAELGASHFDIPAPVRTLECLIAPTQDGGIYYTGPTDDFSRPGRMWWSVPPGDTEFTTWRELTTVYHEGVPGHHLQIATAVFQRDTLNSWRRLLAGTSGHAEGWALYAERLMEELGYLDDPGDRLGMLDAQRMRAARVVLDLGVHLGKRTPEGGAWTFDYALAFFRSHVNISEAQSRFEVQRYFGWPGQAPSYKIGQRLWEQLRDEVRTREGAAFDMKDYHRRVLELGGLRLDTVRGALLGFDA
ncbi:hypothetical protein GCM10025874_18620 [Arenivirga flava]|uniref:DUF885 domain-containing protein n=2 Tax=Arenivirga flava TaxID=1930060 RepID=A0AA37UGY4_9MICO|nr:hypothetical protein GCM10025874_18620 [Arenivirga flava]